MQRIRELLVQGRSHSSIISELGLNERTFYRHLKRIFAQDIKNLERADEQMMMRQVAIHVERANNIYQGLAAIAQDSTIDGEVRLEAYNHMFKLSQSQIQTYEYAPSAAITVRRKLAALEKGIPESMYNNALDRSRFRPSISYDLPMTEQEQQQQQEQRPEW